MSGSINGITVQDFNNKAIDKKYITEEEILTSRVNTINVDIMEYINIILSRSLINVSNVDKVLYDLFQGKYPILKRSVDDGFYYLKNKSGSQEKQNITKELEKGVGEIYAEAVEKLGIDKPNLKIVPFKVDHVRKKLIVLIPVISNSILSKLKEIKKLESITEVRKHTIFDADGDSKIVNKSIKDYSIVFYIAPISLLNILIDANSKVSSRIQRKAEKLEKQKKSTGFGDLKAGSIKFIDDNGSTIDTILKDILIAQAKKGASDIHFEPDLTNWTEDIGQVRLRVSGELEEPIPVTSSFSKGLVRSIKVISKLDVNLYTLPQDGKLVIKVGGIENDLHYRVSVIPIGEHMQEKVVLRKIDNDTSKLKLDLLGMDKYFINLLDNMVGNPSKQIVGKHKNGMILMTGPTGSGKTTTLFAILNQLNTHKVNIQTLEDPIEYVIPNINQSQISDLAMKNTKGELTTYTYAKGLKSILRQDPDIILVGEIRDEETMDVAKDASSTGHLLFSSLHTNDTWETINRIIDLQFDINTIGSTIRMIVAQRLGRVVCPHCIMEYNNPELSVNAEDQKNRERKYINRKMEIYRKLMDSIYMEYLPNSIADMKLYQGKGCINCDYQGEVGRMGIYEFLPMSIKIQDFILEYGQKAPIGKIRDLFIAEKIVTLYQNAVYKAFDGKEKDGEIEYLSYDSAISAIGSDKYGFGEDYKDYSVEQLEELLRKKKKLQKIQKIKEKLKDLELKLSIEKKKYEVTVKEKDKIVIKDYMEKIVKEINKIKSAIPNLK